MFVIQEKQNLPSPNNKIFSSVKLVKKLLVKSIYRCYEICGQCVRLVRIKPSMLKVVGSIPGLRREDSY